MNGKNFGDQFYVSDNLERIDQGANGGPIVDSEFVAENVPVAAATLVQEPPRSEIAADVGPMDDTLVQEAPMGETIVYKGGVGQVVTPAPLVDTTVGSLATLLDRETSEHFRTHWNEIQGTFVDEPRSAVQQADALVAEVIEKITTLFAEEHRTLEDQWKEGRDVSTEDLRQALQHYRSFFNRLVV